MRIAFTSDLHVDISQRNWELVPYLNEVLKIVEPDVFVIAGDISPELGDIEYTLDCFSTLRCLKLFVPGNQDIWVLSESMQEQGHDSYEKYYFYLPELCRRNDFVPLWMEPAVVQGVGFVGTIGWYDHALKPGVKEPDFDKVDRSLVDSVWSDMRWACWSDISMMIEGGVAPVRRPDMEVAREFNLRLDQDLEAFSREASVEEVVSVTHYPPFQELVKAGRENKGESLFPVSRDMANILLSYPKVSLSISGHIHSRKDIMVGNIRAVSCPVGYRNRDHRRYQDIVKDCLEVIYLIDRGDFLPRGGV
ncbi:MAG: metallophosphoesterase [Actinomycetota bacterium]|nr:metallophosphoesterase [Actinomycetota bacterium]